jgi:hypothetical protein
MFLGEQRTLIIIIIIIIINLFILNRVFLKITWENILEQGRPQMKIWHICIIRWIPKATNTYSEYVMFVAFLHGNYVYAKAPRCSFYTYIAFHFKPNFYYGIYIIIIESVVPLGT